MGDADTQIQASVVITSDTAGAKRATTALNEVNAAGGKAAEGTQKLGNATRVSTEEFTRAARMASAAGGSLEGVGSIIQMLGTRIAGFAAAIPIIGLVWAAFEAWKTVITTLIERHREHERLLRSIKDSNAAAAIDSTTAAYGRMSAALDLAAEKTRTMREGQMEMVKVEQDLNEAKLKTAETAELIAEKDPIKQDAIRARYVAMQQSGQAGTAIKLQAMKTDQMKDDLASNEEQLNGKRLKERDLMRSMSHLSKAATDPIRSEDERKSALSAQSKASAALIENRNDQQKLEMAITRLVDQLAVEDKRTEVMRLTGSDSQTRQGIEVQKQEERVRVAEIEKQRAALEQQRVDAESQLARVQERESSAQTFVDGAQSRIDAGTFNARENADSYQILVAMRDQRDFLQSVVTNIRREQEKTSEILRTLSSSR